MKKLLALTLTCALSASLLAGCGATPSDSGATPAPTPSAPAAAESPAPEQGVKTGLSVQTTVTGADAGEKDGSIKTEILAVAVVVAEDGTVANCRLDILEANAGVTAQGRLTGIPETLATKTELGDSYGMKKASSIGKEWYEQAAAFETWTVGKTAAEITGSVDGDGKSADVDLVSGCTVHVGDFVQATAAAMENARVLGAGQDDRLGLSIIGSESGDQDGGTVTVNAGLSAVTVDAQGIVTSEALDAVEAVSSFDASGAVSVPGKVPSKVELGDSYGLKSASSIGKEWYEQMDAFAAYMTGKDAGQVAAAVDGNGKAADAALLSGCTIHVAEPVKLTLKAMETAH